MSGKRKLSAEMVAQLREWYDLGDKVTDLAEAFGITVPTVYKYCRPTRRRGGLKKASRLLKTPAAAKYINCSPATLRDLGRSGKISFIPGHHFRWDTKDLDAHIEASKTKAQQVQPKETERPFLIDTLETRAELEGELLQSFLDRIAS